MVLLTALLFASIAAQIVNPLIMRHFIDAARAHSPLFVLTRAALLFLSLALLFQVTAVAETYVAELIGWRVTNRMRADLASHCLRLDMSFHKAHLPGEMIERIDGDVSTLSNYFSRLIVSVAANVLLALGMLVVISVVSLPTGLCIFALLIAGGFALAPIQRLGVAASKATRQASSDQFGFLEERISGTEDIRACGAAEYTLGRLYPLMRTLYEANVRSWLTSQSAWGVVNITFIFGQIATLIVGGYFFARHQMTLGTVYLLFDYSFLIVLPLEQLANQMQDIQQAGGSLERIKELLETRSALADPAPEKSLSVPERSLSVPERSPSVPERSLSAPNNRQQSAPALAVENLSFGYDPNAPILHDLSLRLGAGRTLGVLGRTGSGKTTLLRLLFRLYDPQEGTISLDAANVQTLPLRELRARIGLVTQDVRIFHASVRDNLTFFDETITEEWTRQALEEVGLWDWCAALPQGLDTPLESGSLSAGEAQLLSLARVFLKDPDVILFDEFSSRLDPATELSLRSAVDRLLAGRTAIIVAHRLETVQRVDEILVLDQGRIQEHGRREDLLKNRLSHYAQLLEVDRSEGGGLDTDRNEAAT